MTTASRKRPKASLRIGRVARIDIRVHLSFTILLAVVVLGASAPGPPSVARSVLWLVMLFGSIVAHELAHSLVAQSYGVRVAEIDLLPIGGVSKMTSEPTEPGQQLRIAAAGPLTSLVLGAVLVVLALVVGHDVWPPTLLEGSLIAAAGWANLMLGAFNLLPAYPMDGGRVLRAVLAEHVGGERADRIAARTGRRLAIVMVVTGFYFNLWLLIIGLFVYFGSWSEQLGAATRATVHELRVRDVMVPPTPTELTEASGDAEPADALLADTDLLDADFVARPVVRDGQVVGVIRSEDLDTIILRRVRDRVR